MIHEIYPKKYNPEYINRRITGDDYLLSYRKDGILVKRNHGMISLPKCSDYQEICGFEHGQILDSIYYLFAIDDDFFYEATKLPEKVNDDLTFYMKLDDLPEKTGSEANEYFYLRIHRFRELDPVHMVFAGATGYHIRNWRRTSKYCGCCAEAPDTAGQDETTAPEETPEG